MAYPGHRPHAQAQPLPKIIRGDAQSWGTPWRGEPTRQEPALLSNHDGAAAPGPARLCNDLKQESRATGPPTPFQTWATSQRRTRRGGRNLEPGTWNPDLNLTSTLDSNSSTPRLSYPQRWMNESRSSPALTSPLVVLTDADADAGPVPRYHPAAIIRHQKSAATPNITTTGWDMIKCGLGHAVPNTAIDRPSAPPFDAAASMGNRSGRQMFAYGCPLSKMDISLILSIYAPWAH